MAEFWLNQVILTIDVLENGDARFRDRARHGSLVVCGSSPATQDVFQFNDAVKTRAFPWAHDWQFLYFKQFHLSTAGLGCQSNDALKHDIDAFSGFQTLLWKTGKQMTAISTEALKYLYVGMLSLTGF